MVAGERGAPWPLPWREADEGRISRRGWLGLAIGFALLHWAWLGVAVAVGNFDPEPNPDHARIMRQVLEEGRPHTAVWPPGFGYYLAATQALTRSLGLPFWSGKVFLDVVSVVGAGLLSVALGWRLTGRRSLALAAGFGQLAAPIFGLASAEGLAVVLFQPLFLAALLLLVIALQRPHPSRARVAGAGALLGGACLVRANPQFLPLALAPLLRLVRRRQGATRPWRGAAALLAILVAGEAVVLLPWALLQRHLGQSGAFAAPVVYYAFFDGIRRHDGFRVSEALRREPPPELSLQGVVAFHRRWLADDPAGLLGLYAAKFARSWYLSDSGRWDRWILALHAPFWILATLGAIRWWWFARGDPCGWS